MDFINNIDNNSLIICSNLYKEDILLEINKLDKLLDIKIMSLNEFLNSFFFTYNEETIYYLKNKYNLNIDIINIYLNNLKYIINSNINNSKINKLKDIYNELKDNNLLKENRLFKDYLKNINIYVIDLDIDIFTKSILENYKVNYINTLNNKRIINDLYHFKSIEDEVSYTFNKISELLKNNIDSNNIKLILLGNEYKSIIKRFSYLYNINISNIDNYSLYGTIESNNLINLIKENKSKEEIFNYIKDLDDKYINIINKYYFIDDLNIVLDLIINDLKNTNIIDYSEGIEIINLNSYIKDNYYVFILGFNLENIPIIHKDIDYFNDILKSKLNLYTSFELNNLEKNNIIKRINNIKNLSISYKDYDSYKNYFKSNLINNLKLDIKDIYLNNNTSNLYNKILLTNKLDNLIKYNIKDNNLDILYNTYPNINYLSYDNSYHNINTKLNNITLSYTSLNTYYHCSFRYYIDNILRLNIYEESFKQFIGTMFHDILSKIYNKDFNFELEWNNYIKDKEFTKKELFYLKDLKLELESVIKILDYQYTLTGLTNVLLEKEIDIDLDNHHFKGIIDKIMFKEKDNNTYLSIIDYKTGNPKINIDNIKYGIDMQLPIYVYLVLKSNLFNNPKVIGFYLQKIINEKNNNELIDNLKLQGYSIDDPYLVSMFDSSYENSSMIKSMKIISKGFSHYTKVLSEDEILNICKIVEDKIIEVFNNIEKNNFKINPKVINGENIGCSFCKYKDICYMTGKDLEYLKE